MISHDIKLVKTLLQNGENPNISPAIVINLIKNNNSQILDQLFLYGFNPNLTGKNNEFAIKALEAHDLGLITKLVLGGIDTDDFHDNLSHLNPPDDHFKDYLSFLFNLKLNITRLFSFCDRSLEYTENKLPYLEGRGIALNGFNKIINEINLTHIFKSNDPIKFINDLNQQTSQLISKRDCFQEIDKLLAFLLKNKVDHPAWNQCFETISGAYTKIINENNMSQIFNHILQTLELNNTPNKDSRQGLTFFPNAPNSSDKYFLLANELAKLLQSTINKLSMSEATPVHEIRPFA